MSTGSTPFDPARWKVPNPVEYVRARAREFEQLGGKLYALNQQAKALRGQAIARKNAALAAEFQGIQYRTHERFLLWQSNRAQLHKVAAAYRWAEVTLGGPPPVPLVAVAVVALLAAGMAYLFYSENTERRALELSAARLAQATKIVEAVQAGQLTPEQARAASELVKETGDAAAAPAPKSGELGDMLKTLAAGVVAALVIPPIITALRANTGGE